MVRGAAEVVRVRLLAHTRSSCRQDRGIGGTVTSVRKEKIRRGRERRGRQQGAEEDSP